MKNTATAISENYKWYIDNQINESSLGRFKQHYDNGNLIAFISGCRAEFTPQQCRQNGKEIGQALRKAGFGFTHVKGGFIENYNTEDAKAVEEATFAIFAPIEREEELRKLLTSLAKKYNQDSFLFVGADRKAKYITKNGNIDCTFNTWKPSDAEQYFTRIGNKKFTFYECVNDELPYGSNAMSNMIMSRTLDMLNENADAFVEKVTKGVL